VVVLRLRPGPGDFGQKCVNLPPL